ncbi:MAG TPA: acyl-CoA dehydrogenase family protein [Hyphomicrobiaceae bacterium]|nr:acyl-CoA dehydrogenase family protein [Hyphomicrobiaceae bacterium]
MDFQLTSEQRLIQESTRRMVARDIQPVLDAHDPDRPLPKEVMRKLLQVCATQGLTSARVPQSAGGAGLSTLTYGLMFEQLPPVVAFAIVGQEATAARIALESTDEQRERLLPDIIAARKITCTGSTEPDAGSDHRGIKTRAVLDGDHVIIDGRKMWITNASICDVINITATLGAASDGSNRMVRVVVDREESPFETAKTPCLGFCQGHLGEVVFEKCRVPRRNLLGQVGDAARVLTLTWLANRPLFGLMATNMAQRALDAAIKYAGDRTQFGRSIASYQLVQELLADIAAAVTTSRLICYYALNAIDNGDRANGVSAQAKRYAIAACQRAISMAMEVHGSMGISREVGLEQLYRDCRMLPIPDGTNQILTLIEGRELTGIPAYRP